MSKNIDGRRTQKNILMIIAALVAVLAAAAFFLRPGWRKSTSGTRFFDTHSLAFVRGMHRDGGKLYCFDDDTYLLYGWISYRGGLYYSGSDGAVCTGRTEIDGHTYYFDSTSGRLVTGWETLPDGRRRYRGYDGVPVSGETTVDGAEFLFDSEGFPVCGFYTSSAGTRYYSENGASNGLCEIDGDVYFFTKYIMQTGICATPDGDMFFAPDGKRLTGLIRNGSDTLYAADNGILVTGWQTTEGGLFYFTPAYTAAPDGFYTIDGRTYLFEGGAALLGWQTVGGKLYYFSADDGMYTGWRTVDGTEMLFSSSGELSGNGFTRTDGKTFYLRDGELLSGWQVIEGKKYYFDPTDGMASGKYTVDGKEWFFLDSGELAEGWVTYGDRTFYYLDNRRADGETVIDGTSYYFSGDDGLIRGFFDRDGRRYLYDEHGFMLTGWQERDGQRYYLGADGVMLRDTEWDIYRLDADGVASPAPASLTNLDAYLDHLLGEYTAGGDYHRIWRAVRGSITYKFMDVPGFSAEMRRELSVEALNSGTGSCYHFSSLAYCLFERLGYTTEIVHGYDPLGYSHYWLKIYDPSGEVFYSDPVYSLYAGQTNKMTLGTLLSYGYTLD